MAGTLRHRTRLCGAPQGDRGSALRYVGVLLCALFLTVARLVPAAELVHANTHPVAAGAAVGALLEDDRSAFDGACTPAGPPILTRPLRDAGAWVGPSPTPPADVAQAPPFHVPI